MTTIEITVPDILSKFDRLKTKEVLLGAIRHVVVAKLKEEKKEKEKALRNIKKYERKYKMSIEEFEKNMPKDADYQLHEDWIDWSFWNSVYKRIEKDIQKFQVILGEM
jgi:uncharacterized membrane protein YheB (UPF0754 family)